MARTQKTIRAAVLWTVAAAALMANHTAAHAEDTDGATFVSDDIVVTAQRRSQNIQEVPIAITAISGETLEATGVGRTAGEIVRFVPNASAATLDNHGFPRWFLRGIGTGEPSLNNVTPIGIYQDDVYLGSAFMTGGPLFDLERVEVLPGPQGTLWGKNSPGGAIHFVSRKPTFNNAGFLDASLGNYSDRRIQGAVNQVLSDGKFAVRLSGSSEGADLYARNLAKGTRGKLSDDAVRLLALGKLTDDLEALGNVHYRRFKQNDMTSYVNFGQPGQVDSYGNPYITFPNRIYNFNAPANTSREQYGASLTLNWSRGDYALTSITAYERAEETSTSDTDLVPQEVTRGYAANRIEQISQEIRLASPRQDRFNWIAGAHYFHQIIDATSAGASLNIPTLYPGTTPQYNDVVWGQTNESFAVFASATYQFTDRLSLTAGARWTWEEKALNTVRRRSAGAVRFANPQAWWDPAFFSGVLNPTVHFSDTKDWSAVTWDISPEYSLTDHARVYLRVARGFRGGGFIAAPTTQAGAGGFDPEYITAFEGGLKSEWLGGRLTFNAAAFYYDYKDIQINIYKYDPLLGQAVSRMQNAADATVYGAEFQSSAVIGDRLRVRASVGLLHTEYKNYRDAAGNDYSGNEFARAPDFTGILAADYTVPLGDHDLVLSGDLNGRTKFIFSATDADNPAQQHPGYVLANLRAAYQLTDQVRVTGYVDNVFDKAYWQATSPISPTAVGRALGAPRTYGVAVNYKW